MNPKRIGFVGYDGVQALDFVGPLESFQAASTDEQNGKRPACYETLIIGLTGKPFKSETGIIFQPHKTFQNAPPVDTLIIPGGCTLRTSDINSQIANWLKPRARNIRRIASDCTGVYALAASGLLNGRTVSTHWKFAKDLSNRFPDLKVDANLLFVKDGKYYTSAGITAGIDLSLALIEEDFGPSVALSVARELVVYLKRSGGQEQFSEPLQFQTQTMNGMADLAAWAHSHLQEDLSVDALADRACLGRRHFNRKFKGTFGVTPASFVETLRLDEARERLARHSTPIEQVALSVGFQSAKAFRRAFERRFGVSPSAYRSRFTRAVAQP